MKLLTAASPAGISVDITTRCRQVSQGFKMKIAYLVFAYKNPRLLKRTVERLSCSDSSFFIHIDLKCDLEDFRAIRGENIVFADKRVRVSWAEFSGVKAVLMLIQAALVCQDKFEYFLLLSGSEYPLQSSEYIHKFLVANQPQEFISIVKMPNAEAGKPVSRINTLRIPSEQPVRRLLVRTLARLGLAQRDYRKHLGSLEPYSGHTWWALTREACQYIIDFGEHNVGVVKYFENTFAPEEMYFHTILGNSPFKSRIRRNLVYEDWSSRGSHPAMIDEQHIAFFRDRQKVIISDVYGFGEVLFARKFSDDNWDMVRRIEEARE